MGKRVIAFLFVSIFFLSGASPAFAENEQTEPPAAVGMTAFERKVIEQGFRLLPYDHPFVVAYERTYGVKIDSYTKEINGKIVSGIPYQFGGKYSAAGFSDLWWTPTEDANYPLVGLDCSGYVAWIYAQLGYQIPIGSAGQFFAGKTGALRLLDGVQPHLVIPSFEQALIGDIAYNSAKFTYTSGDSSHVQLYIGTADKLGITAELQKLMPKFPGDAHLVLDCGWADGTAYYTQMKNIGVKKARKDMGGVGVQFFTSIKAGSKYLYRAPRKTYKWKNSDTKNTYRIDSVLETKKRYLQHNAKLKIQNTMNLSRPIIRTDGRR